MNSNDFSMFDMAISIVGGIIAAYIVRDIDLLKHRLNRRRKA